MKINNINDIVGNLRMFVNCNKAFGDGASKGIYMSNDTFDALCSVFQTALYMQYPYNLGRSSNEEIDATIYGVKVIINDDMKFGFVRMGDRIAECLIEGGAIDDGNP